MASEAIAANLLSHNQRMDSLFASRPRRPPGWRSGKVCWSWVESALYWAVKPTRMKRMSPGRILMDFCLMMVWISERRIAFVWKAERVMLFSWAQLYQSMSTPRPMIPPLFAYAGQSKHVRGDEHRDDCVWEYTYSRCQGVLMYRQTPLAYGPCKIAWLSGSLLHHIVSRTTLSQL